MMEPLTGSGEKGGQSIQRRDETELACEINGCSLQDV
jgi:hypothetical protein